MQLTGAGHAQAGHGLSWLVPSLIATPGLATQHEFVNILATRTLEAKYE
jgi:hypothetical protein